MPAALLPFLLAFAGPCRAAPAPQVPPCVVMDHGKRKEPATLEAMLRCQKNALQTASDAWATAHSADAPDDVMDGWMDQQRVEMRDYIARHRDATIDDSGEDHPASSAPAGAQAATPAAPLGTAQGQAPDDTTLSDDDAFKQKMWADSNAGKNGITPEMAQDMAKRIDAQQGYVSPDMQALLDAVSKDGAKLTPATVEKLKAAAQDANSSGMDLGVSPDVQNFLLKDDQQGPPTN